MSDMKIPFSPPDVTDLECQEVREALLSGWITTGPRTKAFERQLRAWTGQPLVALNSATAALELGLHLLGIGPGDEVIVPAYTYTATASVVLHVGASLRFCDSAQDSLEMDLEALAGLITERTKAIIYVDLAGRLCAPAGLRRVVEAARTQFRPSTERQEALGRIALIADSAHAFGARQRVDGDWHGAGDIADLTAFSFHAVKNLTTAEGGALGWRVSGDFPEAEVYQELQLLSLHGQSKDALAKTRLGAWEYDILYPAYKCNMTDIHAAIGLKQLERYPEMLRRRRELVARYDQELGKLGLKNLRPHDDAENESSCHLYLAQLPGATELRRNAFISRMAERGVALNVHYKPLPMMTAYRRLGFDIANFPRAFAHYQGECSFPLYSRMSDKEQTYVLEMAARCLRAI